jgi:hypothetical protein
MADRFSSFISASMSSRSSWSNSLNEFVQARIAAIHRARNSSNEMLARVRPRLMYPSSRSSLWFASQASRRSLSLGRCHGDTRPDQEASIAILDAVRRQHRSSRFGTLGKAPTGGLQTWTCPSGRAMRLQVGLRHPDFRPSL